jgi:hypothetical protein
MFSSVAVRGALLVSEEFADVASYWTRNFVQNFDWDISLKMTIWKTVKTMGG